MVPNLYSTSRLDKPSLPGKNYSFPLVTTTLQLYTDDIWTKKFAWVLMVLGA